HHRDGHRTRHVRVRLEPGRGAGPLEAGPDEGRRVRQQRLDLRLLHRRQGLAGAVDVVVDGGERVGHRQLPASVSAASDRSGFARTGRLIAAALVHTATGSSVRYDPATIPGASDSSIWKLGSRASAVVPQKVAPSSVSSHASASTAGGSISSRSSLMTRWADPPTDTLAS